LLSSSSSIQGSNNYDDLAGSDLIIVTAGLPRKPGMSRDDLLDVNFGIIKAVADKIKAKAPNAFVLVVTNPLDAMVYAMQKLTGFPAHRVIGMAGVLDSTRFAAHVASEAGVNPGVVQAVVMGGHGDTMVPLLNYVTIAGIPAKQFISMDRLKAIADRTSKAGGEVVALLKTGSAFYSPAISAIRMGEAYLKDRKDVITCAALLNGQYGVKGLYCGVPVVVGQGGVEKILEIQLEADEKAAFDKSVAAVKEMSEWVDKKIAAS
jgi:malate dehydrogenase